MGLVGLLGAGAIAGAAYVLAEPYLFRVARHELPLVGSTVDLDVLHISDLHLSGRDKARARFVASLPDRLSRTPI